MATTYPMPQWGITMEEGTVTQWSVEPGQRVEEGDVLAEVGTDKIDIDYESPASGVVAALLVDVGQSVACGTPLIVIADDDEDLAAYRAENA